MKKEDKVFICSHGCRYTEFELECGMSMATMDYLMSKEVDRWNLEQDLVNEDKLARIHILGESECPWPWYADDPNIIQEPQIFLLAN